MEVTLTVFSTAVEQRDKEVIADFLFLLITGENLPEFLLLLGMKNQGDRVTFGCVSNHSL